MHNQNTLTGNAATQSIHNKKADLFLFDLHNEANERGLKQGWEWLIQLATDEDMVSMKKQHNPIVSVRLQGSALLNVFIQVKNGLKQDLNANDLTLTDSMLEKAEKRHLAAYPVKTSVK